MSYEVALKAHYQGIRSRLYPAPTPRMMRTSPDLMPGLPAPFNMLLPPSKKALISLVALKHGFTPQELMARSRRADLVRARQEAMRLIYSHCQPVSTPQIGRLFGRDHSTVLHAIKIRSQGISGVTPAFNTTSCEIAA